MGSRSQSSVLAPGASASVPRRAVILAAGSGSRLLPLTRHRPKCLLEVAGQPLLARTLQALGQCGLKEVCLVVGHCAEQVRREIGERCHGVAVAYVEAPHYRTTNNLYSLWEVRDHCREDLILVEGDVLFEPEAVRRLLRTSGNAMAVAPCRSWHAGTVVRCSDQGQVREMLLDADPALWCSPSVFKTVNLYRLQAGFLEKHLLPGLAARVEEERKEAFYELVLRDLIAAGFGDFSAVDVGDLRWCEIDDHRDLELAGRLFAPPAERYELMRSLHGGYWRHLVTDHAYIYNPYFPCDRMFAELHRDLRAAVGDYPVGQKELAGLVGAWAGVPADWVAVANGASELIKILGRQPGAGWTVAVPGFNEFESAVGEGRLNRFPLLPPDFDLDVEAFAGSCLRFGAELAVVESPNNPTSRSVAFDALRGLARRLASGGCRLLVDESFVEYSRHGRGLARVLEHHPNLAILKSLSKVCGVAGLRLGTFMAADAGWVRQVRDQLPIWNVNGLGESFLRMLPRFEAELRASCRRVQADRDELFAWLSRLPGVAPLAPDANFVLCRLAARSAPEVARQLFIEDNILVKECSNKSMPEADRYLRIASRTSRENERLVAALGRILAG